MNYNTYTHNRNS